MPTTANLSLPYPDPTDAPNGPSQVQGLAQALDVLLGAAWVDYTPTIAGSTTNPVLGTGGSIVGRYQRVGKTVRGWYVVIFGTAGVSAGSGNITVSLPVTGLSTSSPYIGTVYLQDVSAVTESVRGIRVGGGMGTTAVGLVTHAVPVPWAVNDSIRGSFMYETT